MRQPTAKGFTLIELLVVVAIVAMLAAVGIPNILRNRMVAQERTVLDALRQTAKSCHYFFVVNQTFPNTLTVLGLPTSDPPYLDTQLIGDGTTATKAGYTFTYTQTAGGTDFTVLANPIQHGVTGERHFYVDRTLAVRGTTANRDATISDPLVF